jgi:CRISPR-associated protein Cas2
MFIVVSYDIPDDRRRTRVMKALKDFGARVQYSVFECDLKAKDYRRMRERLSKLIDRKEDSLLFYALCQEDVKKRRIWGVKRAEASPNPWYLVREKVDGKKG